MGSAAALPSLLLCILQLTAGASAEPRYVVIFPSVLYYPHPSKVHIHLMDLEEPVQVTLHLKSSYGIPNVTLEAQGNDILQLDWPRFSNVSTPPAGTYELANLHVSIQGGSLQVSEQRKVLVKSLELGILVQTDKKFYKPGQTVKFRILCLDQTLIPSNGEVRQVKVVDPRGNHVVQWEKVSPRQGIVDLSFQLAANVTLGTYIIEVMGKRHLFTVENYTAPAVRLAAPEMMLHPTASSSFPLFLFPPDRYPSGKSFRGRAEAKLCHAHFLLEESEWICVEVGGQTGRNGCFSTEVPAASFKLNNLLNAKFCVWALLLEEGTHEHSQANSQPVMSSVVMAALQLNCSSPFRASISTPQGELKDEPPNSKHEGKDYLNYETGHCQLYPILSHNKNFLKIRRVEKKLPCGQPRELWVDYLFDEEAIGTEPQSMDVVFLVS
ncbi:A2ML1 protein, partial [Rostratula benghalensis]|nr:A2ML1 protein [Rostratula benghalensis]